MADERGGEDNNVNDNMGNQLQLFPGDKQMVGQSSQTVWVSTGGEGVFLSS